MTAQISDTILHHDINFAIAGTSSTPLFDLTILPFKPVSLSSACWRGYVANYSFLEQRLYLNSLTVGLPPDWVIRARAGKSIELFGVLPKSDGDFSVLYEGFSLPMLWTGGLLLADGFIRELYTHMGFHPAWKYEHVREVIFDAGHMVEDHDRSAAISALRAETIKTWASSEAIPRLRLQSEMSARMETCFSHDYSKRSSCWV